MKLAAVSRKTKKPNVSVRVTKTWDYTIVISFITREASDKYNEEKPQVSTVVELDQYGDCSLSPKENNYTLEAIPLIKRSLTAANNFLSDAIPQMWKDLISKCPKGQEVDKFITLLRVRVWDLGYKLLD
jgi:hypothetical protein